MAWVRIIHTHTHTVQYIISLYCIKPVYIHIQICVCVYIVRTCLYGQIQIVIHYQSLWEWLSRLELVRSLVRAMAMICHPRIRTFERARLPLMNSQKKLCTRPACNLPATCDKRDEARSGSLRANCSTPQCEVPGMQNCSTSSSNLRPCSRSHR